MYPTTVIKLGAVVLATMSLTTVRVSSRPHKTDATLYQSYFEKDSRLNAPMTIQSASYMHLRLWRAIARTTKVPIDREQNAMELDTDPVALAGKDVPARALMDAAAARILARWERTEKKGYRLLVPQAEMDRGYGASNEYERERFRAGRAFIRALMALPAEERSRMESGQSVPFTSLPSDMQMAVTEMLQSLARQAQVTGWTVFPVARVAEAEFRLERKPSSEFNRLWLQLKVPGQDVGFRINDYEEKKQERAGKARQKWQQMGEPDGLYIPEKFEVSQEAAKRLPALKRVVQIDAEGATFPKVLWLLHEKYGIAFLSDPKRTMPQRADVHLPPMPLGEALDKLTKIYKDTEWEYRKLGFIIVRGPRNPSREPKQKQVSATVSRPTTN